jgi:acetyl-CoA C-acetyltransferase
MEKVVVVGGKRLPFVKSFSHYREHSVQELMTEVLNAISDQFDLSGKVIPEVALGAVTKHSADWNLARESVLGSSLSPYTPAYDLQRACGTSFEAFVQVANKIQVGQIEFGIAGGVDTNSEAPITFSKATSRKIVQIGKAKTFAQKIKLGKKIRPRDFLPQFPSVTEPRTGKSMGEHCELMVQKWQIPRADQDQLALESHQKAAKAYSEGYYEDELIRFLGVDKDLILRPDTNLESLQNLKPVFDREKGSLTAGNSTPLTDGASGVLLASEKYAKEKNWPILAYFEDAQAAAVDFVGGDGLLMAPTFAVANLLKRKQLSFEQIDIFEIHEAFAGQVLCTLKAWESDDFCRERLNLNQALGPIDRAKMNIKGGSLAIGHPFAATGTRIIHNLAKILKDRPGEMGLISICTAGGMGVAGIFKGPNQ